MTTYAVSKEKAAAVSAEIKEAVEKILAKHELQIGQIRSGHGEWFEFKVTAEAIQQGPNGVNLASKEATYYTKFGFTAYDDDYKATELVAPLGTIFKNGTKEYVFSGVNPQKRKFPIQARRTSDGEMVGLPEAIIPVINMAVAQ